MDSKLVPILALITEFGYQLKIDEAFGSFYSNRKLDSFDHKAAKTGSYFILRIEDVGENRNEPLPKSIGHILLSEEELMGLYKALGRIAEEKGY